MEDSFAVGSLLKDLSEQEIGIVRECLTAAANGPFFPDWEFHSLFGCDRNEIRKIATAWPDIEDRESDAVLAVVNSLNSLLGYPHGMERQWQDFISASRGEVEALLRKCSGTI